MAYRTGMCRSIKTLRRADEVTTTGELEAAARQYVRKISGYAKPSARNAEAFDGGGRRDRRRDGAARGGARGADRGRPRQVDRARSRNAPACVTGTAPDGAGEGAVRAPERAHLKVRERGAQAATHARAVPRRATPWWVRPGLDIGGRPAADRGRGRRGAGPRARDAAVRLRPGTVRRERPRAAGRAGRGPVCPFRLRFALKANPLPEVLEVFRGLGAPGTPDSVGIDACSPGEVVRALSCGWQPDEISFTGTNVSERDLDVLLAHGIHVNLDAISQVERYGRRAPGTADRAADRSGRRCRLQRPPRVRRRPADQVRDRARAARRCDRRRRAPRPGDRHGPLPRRLGLAGRRPRCASSGRSPPAVEAVGRLTAAGHRDRRGQRRRRARRAGAARRAGGRSRCVRRGPGAPPRSARGHGRLRAGRRLSKDAAILLGEVVTVEARRGVTFVGLDIGWNVNCSYFIYRFAQELVVCRAPDAERTEVVTDRRSHQRGGRRLRRGLPDAAGRGGRHGRAAQRRRLPPGDELDPLPAPDGRARSSSTARRAVRRAPVHSGRCRTVVAAIAAVVIVVAAAAPLTETGSQSAAVVPAGGAPSHPATATPSRPGATPTPTPTSSPDADADAAVRRPRRRRAPADRPVSPTSTSWRRVNDDRATVERLNAALPTAVQAQDPGAVRSAAVDILDFVDAERDWLRENPPADVLRGRACVGRRDARRVRRRRRRVHRLGRDGRRLAGLAALGDALDAAQAAERRPDDVRSGARGDVVPGLSRRRPAARPARDEPPDRGRPRRVARGPRRPGRRRGAARDPRRRPAPGPGRGRGHDADARPRGRARRRVPADGGPDRRPGGRSARAAATRRSLSQPDDTILVRLSKPFDDSKVAERHFVATASCGICGKASIDEVAVRCDPLPDGPVVRRSVILALPDLLRAAQRGVRRDRRAARRRPVHAAGELVAIREDVGRHNALDKLVGSQVLAGALPLHERILLMVSGRVSFEIVQKAAVAGIPIVCAVSAPSDLAIETAERLGVTLVGFLRGDGFNVYSPRRPDRPARPERPGSARDLTSNPRSAKSRSNANARSMPSSCITMKLDQVDERQRRGGHPRRSARTPARARRERSSASGPSPAAVASLRTASAPKRRCTRAIVSTSTYECVTSGSSTDRRRSRPRAPLHDVGPRRRGARRTPTCRRTSPTDGSPPFR